MESATSQSDRRTGKRPRRWFQFSLRTFLLASFVLTASLGSWILSAKQQRDAVASLRKLGGDISIDYSYQRISDEPLDWRPRSDPAAVSWVPRFALDGLGQDFFHNVVSVNVFQGVNGKEPELALQLSRLRNLEQLVLIFVKANDSFVERLADLRQLTGLEIGDASLIAGLEIGDASLIAGLEIGDASLTDESLRLVSRLPKLQLLELRGRFTDKGLASLEHTKTLRSLSLKHATIGDEGVASLGRLTNLERLSLDSSHLSGKGLAKLTACTKLKRLSLRHSWIKDEQLAGLGALPLLEDLDLTGAKAISGIGLRHLQGAKNLKVLNLGLTSTNNKGVRFLAEFPNLEKLDLFDTQVTDPAIAILARMPNLQEINLRDTGVRLASLQQFKESPRLRTLFVPRRPLGILMLVTKPTGLTADEVKQLQAALPRCAVGAN